MLLVLNSVYDLSATFSAIVKALTDRMLCRPDVKLRLMLQSRAEYAVFIGCQSYQRNFCDGLEMKFTSPLGGIQQAGAAKQLERAFLLVLLPVSDYKHVYKFVFYYHQLPHGAQTSGKGQPRHEFPIFGPYTMFD